MHITRLLAAVSVAIGAAGCTGAPGDTNDALTGPSAAPSPLQAGTDEIAVSRVRVFLIDGRPKAYVEGPLGGGCTHLDPVIQHRDGNSITLTMTSTTTSGGPCTMIFKYVNEWVPLAGTFDAGMYELHVNDATAAFRISAAPSGGLRIEPDPGPPPVVPAPTPGVVSPNDPPGSPQNPGQVPGAPGQVPGVPPGGPAGQG
jgi:hypothetical protein